MNIREATYSDIPSLVSLNEKWQRKFLNDLSRGFLSTTFMSDIFLSAIDESEIVVTEMESYLAGYYLIYNSAPKHMFVGYENPISTLIAAKQLKSADKIALGAQVIVDADFQGKGLCQAMLKELLELVRNKYDYVLSKVAHQNIRAWNVHAKDGWKPISQNSDYVYVFIEVRSFLII